MRTEITHGGSVAKGLAYKGDVQWMTPRHMPGVLDIESARFGFPWSRDDFIRCLRQKNCIGKVAENSAGRTVGYIVTELHRNRFHILNLAVHAAWDGRGVGRAMVREFIGKLSPQRRNRIMCEVRASNLDAQLFFKAMGFRAISILRDFYEDAPGEDAYLFQYRYTGAST